MRSRTLITTVVRICLAAVGVCTYVCMYLCGNSKSESHAFDGSRALIMALLASLILFSE